MQGIIGFGFALLAVPLINIFLPLTTVVPIIVISSTLINIIVLISEKRYIMLKQIWVLVLFSIIGIPLGVFALKNIDVNIMKLWVGLVIILTSIAMLKGVKVKFENKSISQGMAGFLSGVLNGAISMSGPPIVIFFANEGYDKRSLKANMALQSLITNIITIFTFMYSGLINTPVINISGLCIGALLVGTFSGVLLSRKIEENVFRKFVLIFLVVMGSTTVFTALL